MSVYDNKKFNEWSYIWVILLLMLINLSFQTSEYFAALVGDKPEIWFQRSGSVIVAFAVFIELLMLRKQVLNKKEINLDTNGLYALISRIFGYAMALCVLVGTIIWGYGDLIYLALK